MPSIGRTRSLRCWKTMKCVNLTILTALLVSSITANSAAEVSVSGRRGPVRLTLTLYSNKVQVGQPIWYRVTLTNIGKRRFGVYESAFCSDKKHFMEVLKSHDDIKRELFIVAIGSDGKRLMPYYRLQPRGGSSADIKYKRLGSDFKVLPEEKEDERHVPNPEFFGGPLEGCPASNTLEPGQSLETPVWAFEGFGPGQRPNPPIPPGHFAEMAQFEFKKPGNYRVYAVFDTTPIHFRFPDAKLDELLRKSHEAENPPGVVVRVKTRPLALEVMP